MTWMWMPGQTWFSAASSFLGMWIVMMVAMMLPSLVPMLARYRDALGAVGETRVGTFTAIAGAGYFFVWTAVGLAIHPIGMMLAAMAMRHPALSRATPATTAAITVIVLAVQFSAWKAERLACCREASVRASVLPASASTAWRHGLRLGYECLRCCANLMTVLLLLGVMDLRVMAVVTAAITVEQRCSGIRQYLPA
jgi:predicted metal-binding membrane protein